ncbi:MAG: hypothetical protein HY425_02955 [Candidatus Levybacteria bacterium]|nr:hypothetical protein [Candidatus Levybacteria bacterium]
MSQNFKAIYFSDTQQQVAETQNILTLAFGNKDNILYDNIKSLSSQEIREILGYVNYLDLIRDAEAEGLPLNTFCLWILRKKVAQMENHNKQIGQLGFFLDPIHATFRGGRKDPLQRWYPYLEGYSPKFVELILEQFSPDAKVVYDPFSGLGTTPLVASQLGLRALYSEVNPLLQFLTKVKIDSKNLAGRRKTYVLESLSEILSNLENLIEKSFPDDKLLDTYTATFGKSKFFDEQTFQKVLKSRSLVDLVACTSPVVANLLTIAILSSLVPSSLLQRAGDLRFKTKEELIRKKLDLLASIKNYLEIIIDDLKTIKPLPENPLLITEDARDIESIPSLEIDTVITSPPYLNGTNYFRNTKVELWFLRSLQTNSDLKTFRKKSVTAGINDVSDRKVNFELPISVQQVVSSLEKNSYDRRIPKMVMHYFQDMGFIFQALKRHLKNESILAIDIGDSLYGNIHVPTDRLLIDVLSSIGYEFEQNISLRKRTSRNGTILKQVLLIFRYRDELKNGLKQHDKPWLSKWFEFKTGLPHHAQPFAKRNWGHPLHSLCSYQGKMKPSLAYYLVKTFAKEGDTILDPFAGVGTIPFEASLNGIKSFGFDISPSALFIGQAKLSKPNYQDSLDLIEKLNLYIGENKPTEDELGGANSFGYNNKLKDYFEQKTLNEILLARRYFRIHPPITQSDDLVISSLLHILHGNRPYALSRRSHGITPFAPTGSFQYKSLIGHLKDKVIRSLGVNYPENFAEGKMFFQDATLWWPREVDNLDAIITSPPFFDSTRFHLANWMRLWFCGWEKEDFKAKPLSFIDEKQKQTFDVYEPILRQSRERLKKGGIIVFHLGKSRKCDMANELAKIAKKWFKVEDIFSENVQHTESHGIRDKGTVVEHQFLVLS